MTPERMQQAYELFEQALQRSPEERPSFLLEARGDDAELRTEVNSLLKHDDRAICELNGWPGGCGGLATESEDLGYPSSRRYSWSPRGPAPGLCYTKDGGTVMRRWRVCGMMLGVLCMFGCEHRLGDFTFLSSKNIDLSNLNMEAGKDAPMVEGVDSKPIIIVFGGGPPNLKEAVDRAIESGNGTALSDVSIYYTSWYIPYIVGENKFRVRGKVVR